MVLGLLQAYEGFEYFGMARYSWRVWEVQRCAGGCHMVWKDNPAVNGSLRLGKAAARSDIVHPRDP